SRERAKQRESSGQRVKQGHQSVEPVAQGQPTDYECENGVDQAKKNCVAWYLHEVIYASGQSILEVRQTNAADNRMGGQVFCAGEHMEVCHGITSNSKRSFVAYLSFARSSRPGH